MRNLIIITILACLCIVGCDDNVPEKAPAANETTITTPAPEKAEPKVAEKVIEQPVEQSKEQPAGQPEETPAEVVKQVEEEVEKQPVEIKDGIVLSVTMLTVSLDKFETVDKLWGYAIKGMGIVRRRDLLEESGIVVGTAKKDLSAVIDMILQDCKGCNIEDLEMVIANGSTNLIEIAKGIKVPGFTYANRTYTMEKHEFEEAARALSIAARRIPGRDLVNFNITPVFGKINPNGSDFSPRELKMNITAAPGDTVLIGGARAAYTTLASALLGVDTEKKRTATVLLISIGLLD